MITSLIRSNLKSFRSYKSARSLYQKGVFLDANENSFGSVINSAEEDKLNRYPDPKNSDLRKAIGRFLKVPGKNVFAGNGSDEVIDLLIRLFVDSDEEIMVVEPTYGMYRVAASLAGVKVVSFQMEKDFSINFARLVDNITKKTKIIFCCSPNNPTGGVIQQKDIEMLCKQFKGLVVVDEAYVEFGSQDSLATIAPNLQNLAVLRTFSKAWGLAGIRVGYAVANEAVIECLNKIKAPYNLNRLSGQLAIKALEQYPRMMKMRNLILKERDKLTQFLAKMGFQVYPSEANFLLVKYPRAGSIAKKLAKDFRIIVRDFSDKPLLKNCIRISVGTPKENQLLVRSLKKII